MPPSRSLYVEAELRLQLETARLLLGQVIQGIDTSYNDAIRMFDEGLSPTDVYFVQARAYLAMQLKLEDAISTIMSTMYLDDDVTLVGQRMGTLEGASGGNFAFLPAAMFKVSARSGVYKMQWENTGKILNPQSDPDDNFFAEDTTPVYLDVGDRILIQATDAQTETAGGTGDQQDRILQVSSLPGDGKLAVNTASGGFQFRNWDKDGDDNTFLARKVWDDTVI